MNLMVYVSSYDGSSTVHQIEISFVFGRFSLDFGVAIMTPGTSL